MSLGDVLYTISDLKKVVPDDVLAYLNENFKIIEMMMNSMGTSLETLSGSSLSIDIGKIVTIGLDANKPKCHDRNGRWFYWAEDEYKLYLLRPNP